MQGAREYATCERAGRRSRRANPGAHATALHPNSLPPRWCRAHVSCLKAPDLRGIRAQFTPCPAPRGSPAPPRTLPHAHPASALPAMAGRASGADPAEVREGGRASEPRPSPTPRFFRGGVSEGHSLRVPLVVQAQQGWRCTSPPPTTRAPPRPTASPPDRLPARSPLPLQLCSPALHPRSTGSPALTPPRASRCLAARS